MINLKTPKIAESCTLVLFQERVYPVGVNLTQTFHKDVLGPLNTLNDAKERSGQTVAFLAKFSVFRGQKDLLRMLTNCDL
jgi:hypothetical protein